MRSGDSAHGGRCRARGVKKILKIFKKGVENRKNGVREVPEGGEGSPYRGTLRAGTSTTGAHDAVLEIRSSYIWRTDR